MTTNTVAYPVVYEADMPENLSRWMWLVKWLLVIPHAIVLWFVIAVAIVATVIVWFAVLFTGKYPRGLFDFVAGTNRWICRAYGYLSNLTDKYPAFSMDDDPAYPVRFRAEYSDKSDRMTVFFRFFLFIPHYIILAALSYLFWAIILIHVVIVILTGKPNKDVFRILSGISRWNSRGYAYLFLLTDKYPPFSFE